MHIEISTPALLFPAISLLLLAYTNRFLGLATLIRGLAVRYAESRDPVVLGQIENLRHRLSLIRKMQLFAVIAILGCVGCMFVLFAGWVIVGDIVFALSTVLMMISLGISFREVQLSTKALELELSTVEDRSRNHAV
jgi:hypothetical protein